MYLLCGDLVLDWCNEFEYFLYVFNLCMFGDSYEILNLNKLISTKI